jgi:hypothetical protein
MADATQQAKELQAKGAEDKQKAVKEAYAYQGKPTPTQEECDLAKLGVPLDEHEDDGSGPSPQFRTVITRESEPAKNTGDAGKYQTRTTTPANTKETPTRETTPAKQQS